MFTTAQFQVFANEPSERALARPRHLLRDGKADEAEDAYLEVLARRPDLRLAWGEYFQVLRSQGRFEEALALAGEAASQFGDESLPLALKGAALVELGRFREGLAALEAAAALDPHFGMVWHEAGYAAYRLGEYSRALMALDRSFALEPHSGTLHLRGKILRQAGRFLAAEVAFTGAAESAEYDEQRAEAERQIAITRRYAAFPGRRPGELDRAQAWFAEVGAVVLTTPDGSPMASDEAIVEGLAQLVREQGWRFDGIMALDAWAGWQGLSTSLGLPLIERSEEARIPLVVSRRADDTERWHAAGSALAERGAGLCFLLEQSGEAPPADVAGRLADAGPARLDLAAATATALHPNCRLEGRRLGNGLGW